MSAGAVIAIVVVVLVILGLLAFVMPRMRARAAERARERELADRRDAAATESRELAAARHERADLAERQARIAEQEAVRARAEARLHEERAELHERGLADHELTGDGLEAGGPARSQTTGAQSEADDPRTAVAVGHDGPDPAATNGYRDAETGAPAETAERTAASDVPTGGAEADRERDEYAAGQPAQPTGQE